MPWYFPAELAERYEGLVRQALGRVASTLRGAAQGGGTPAGSGRVVAVRPLVRAKSACSECGKELRAGAKFCGDCGAKVT